MANNDIQNNFIINNDLINDISCNEHHVKNRPYDRYCLTCKKNICKWCENHNSHELVELDSIEPSENNFFVCEDNLEKMKSNINVINEKPKEIKQLEILTRELMDYI